MNKTPFDFGYRMPAEWERHEGTWLAWPKNAETFPGKSLESVRGAFVKIIDALCTGERVHLLVDDEGAERTVLSSVRSRENLVFHRIKSADVWTRDYGPIFAVDGGIAATKWEFNAWGSKYDDLKPDNETGRLIARSSGVPIFETGLVLEGGSVDVNGRGVILTTKQCLLNSNRNPGVSAASIEAALREYLGATKVIWLDRGVAGDDTDGHVDDVARFVNEDTVMCMVEPDETDENHGPLKSNFELLEASATSEGRKLRVVPIQMPEPIEEECGRLPASYANFYIGNKVVLVPTFRDEADSKALSALEKVFTGRTVIGVDCTELLKGFGTIHCVTQQQPALS